LFEIHNYLGLTGVDRSENLRIRRIGQLISYCHIPVVIWLALQWDLEITNAMTAVESYIANLLVWLFFFTQVMFLTILVEDKWRYLRSNWFYVLIFILGIPFILNIEAITNTFRHFRLILVVMLLLPWIDAAMRSLSDNKLGTTLFTSVVIILLSGIFIAGVDPNIPTFWDGIWWAWVTVTTVGYGDLVPISGAGRIFGAVLILMGLALLSVFIANFSAIFVQKEVIKVRKESLYIRKILEDLHKIRQEEEDIMTVLRDVRSRISRLEGKLKKEDEPRED
jgi:voltage-gated potassium channel